MDGVTNFLLTQGVLGISVLVLGWVCLKLYNKIDKLQLRIDELQNLRLQDTKEMSKEVTEVLQGNSQSNYILAEKIEAVKGKYRKL